MNFDTIKFELRDRIAYVTLNRPERLNAMSDASITELRAAARKRNPGFRRVGQFY